MRPDRINASSSLVGSEKLATVRRNSMILVPSSWSHAASRVACQGVGDLADAEALGESQNVHLDLADVARRQNKTLLDSPAAVVEFVRFVNRRLGQVEPSKGDKLAVTLEQEDEGGNVRLRRQIDRQDAGLPPRSVRVADQTWWERSQARDTHLAIDEQNGANGCASRFAKGSCPNKHRIADNAGRSPAHVFPIRIGHK
jgi:hypothetical protein